MNIDNLPPLSEQNIPYYVQIYDIIYQLILDGELKDGDSLPGENVLAEHWHVSRSTIRMAVRKLEEDGCIYKMQGRRTTIKGILQKDRYDLSGMTDPCISCCTEEITDLRTVVRIQNGGRLIADALKIGRETFTVAVVETGYYVAEEQVAASVVIVPLKQLEHRGIAVDDQDGIIEFARRGQYELADSSDVSLSAVHCGPDEAEDISCDILIVVEEIPTMNGVPLCFNKFRMNSDWYRYSLKRK